MAVFTCDIKGFALIEADTKEQAMEKIDQLRLGVDFAKDEYLRDTEAITFFAEEIKNIKSLTKPTDCAIL